MKYTTIEVPEGSLIIVPDELEMFKAKGIDLEYELKVVQEDISFNKVFQTFIEELYKERSLEVNKPIRVQLGEKVMENWKQVFRDAYKNVTLL